MQAIATYSTLSEAALYLGISRQAVNELCQRGTLDSLMVGGRRMIPQLALCELARSQSYQQRSRRRKVDDAAQLDQVAEIRARYGCSDV